MGNSFFCNRCDIEKFQLSKACADQFLNDDNENPLSSEERWIGKLKCLDDAHSKQKGITPETFEQLVAKLEKRLAVETTTFCKNKALLIECLKRNPNCMLNCSREMNEFIDCVDTVRVRRVKLRIQETKKKKVDVTTN